MQTPDIVVSETLTNALSEFEQLRHSGWGRNEAWYYILRKYNVMGQEEDDLSVLVKDWESREIVIEVPPVAEMDTIVIRDAPAIPPQHLAKDTFIANDDTTSFQAAKAESKKQELAEKLTLTLYFRDSPQKLHLEIPFHAEFIIGRSSDSSLFVPHIDLAPYYAAAFGVSRIHASVERHNNNLLLVDLGSRNFTYVNAEQLQPYEVRVIKNGDQVCFGRLLTSFNYKLS